MECIDRSGYPLTLNLRQKLRSGKLQNYLSCIHAKKCYKWYFHILNQCVYIVEQNVHRLMTNENTSSFPTKSNETPNNTFNIRQTVHHIRVHHRIIPQSNYSNTCFQIITHIIVIHTCQILTHFTTNSL